MAVGRAFAERFRGSTLDGAKWFPHYLPAWSSRAATAASFRVGEGLTLEVPPDHPLWCPDLHRPPLRVSGIQSGSWSGPAGSTYGQQRFRDGLVVREEQERFEGWLPATGRVAARAAMDLSPRSMAALWLSGFEDDAEQLRCGELCVFEVFGRSVEGATAEVGVGIKPFRDPALTDDFAAARLPLDVREPHDYAVEWDTEEAVFTVDGEVVRRCAGPPTYPLQLMLAVFDFPEWSVGGDDDLVPRLLVEEVSGWS
ncbi:glycoside hydrolase family 16 protein [Nocardioides sp. CER19]|uniref:glycoside hydrolase family 16 protein n=1 Tax=Nocardioides sp. CER19 TaxID=3038538 RepID=UPI00244731C1|nr:glycoside hydrolase family 16 protein [Nocardioides sp. CER19]MDH2416832.1 glycoside hydrolase family 16 protein [Nocardioides sp. CER19]